MMMMMMILVGDWNSCDDQWGSPQSLSFPKRHKESAVLRNNPPSLPNQESPSPWPPPRRRSRKNHYYEVFKGEFPWCYLQITTNKLILIHNMVDLLILWVFFCLAGKNGCTGCRKPGKKTCRFSSFSASFFWFGKRKKHRNAPFLLGGRSSRFRPTKLKKGMQVRGRETGTHAKRTEITCFFNKLCLNLFRSGSRSVCCILDLLSWPSCPAALKNWPALPEPARCLTEKERKNSKMALC